MSPEKQGCRTNPPSPFPPSQTFGVAEIVLSERLDDKSMKLRSLFRMFLSHMPRRLYLLLLQTSRNTFLGLFSSSGYTPCTRLLLKITRVAHSSLASHPWCTGRSYRKPNVPLYYFRPSPTYKRSIPISFRRNNADLSFPKVMCTLFEVIVGLEARALTLRKFKVVLAS